MGVSWNIASENVFCIEEDESWRVVAPIYNVVLVRTLDFRSRRGVISEGSFTVEAKRFIREYYTSETRLRASNFVIDYEADPITASVTISVVV